ncbi:MAG: hypothetical protein IKU09_11795 [Firmicutes bacterium]|nr:hypothetical protein [Bacillota bacterium]
MKITLEINDIDYGALTAQFLPLVRDKLAEKDGTAMAILAKIAEMPPETAGKMVNLLPQKTRDELILMLLHKNKEKIILAAESYAHKNGLRFRIDDFRVE